MKHATVKHATSTLSRRFAAPVGRLFAAFAEPGAREVWAAPSDDIAVSYAKAEFTTGGEDIAHCTGAHEFTVRTRYCDIRPEARLVMTEVIEMGGAPLGACLVTVEMAADGDGSALVVTIQTAGLDGSGLEAEVTHGWSASFDRLERYLASAIPA